MARSSLVVAMVAVVAVALVGCGGDPERVGRVAPVVRSPIEVDESIGEHGGFCSSASDHPACTQAFVLRDDVRTTDAVLNALRPWGKKLTTAGDTPLAELRFVVKVGDAMIGGRRVRGRLTVSCTRSAVAEINWVHVTPTGLRVLCAVEDPKV